MLIIFRMSPIDRDSAPVTQWDIDALEDYRCFLIFAHKHVEKDLSYFARDAESRQVCFQVIVCAREQLFVEFGVLVVESGLCLDEWVSHEANSTCQSR